MPVREKHSGEAGNSSEASWPDFAVARTKSALEMTAEEFRQHGAARVMEQLDVSSGLIQQTEHLAGLPESDRLAAINAAARLMSANARLAQALYQFVQGETRHRQIVERVQSDTTTLRHSNANRDAEGAAPQPVIDDTLFALLQRRMLLYMNMVAAERLDPELKEAYPEMYETPEPEKAAALPEAAPSV